MVFGGLEPSKRPCQPPSQPGSQQPHQPVSMFQSMRILDKDNCKRNHASFIRLWPRPLPRPRPQPRTQSFQKCIVPHAIIFVDNYRVLKLRAARSQVQPSISTPRGVPFPTPIWREVSKETVILLYILHCKRPRSWFKLCRSSLAYFLLKRSYAKETFAHEVPTSCFSIC